MIEKLRILRSKRAYWEGKGTRIIRVPNNIISKLISGNSLFKMIYVTDVGYYPKAISHFVERKKGSPENIIVYCSTGSGWFENSFGHFKVHPNQFFILPNNQSHRYGSDPDNPWSIYWILFSGKISDEIANIKTILPCFKPNTLLYPEAFFKSYDHMFNRLTEACTFTNILSANMDLWNILMQFMNQNRTESKKLENNSVKDIIVFMKKNLSKKLTVNEMASIVYISPSHFNKLFKLETGYSPLDYFIHLKMQSACDYLRNTTLRIKEIASLVSYDDQYLFSRIFTKTIGKCPRNYRNSPNL